MDESDFKIIMTCEVINKERSVKNLLKYWLDAQRMETFNRFPFFDSVRMTKYN